MEETMKNTVSVDIGGTYTDCYVIHNGKTAQGKDLTTRYNLSVGFMRAIQGCAEALGISSARLLEETDLIRYATTLAMNSLIERTGPKLGLITTAGQEDTIFIGRGSQHYDALPVELAKNFKRLNRPEPLIPRGMVVGIRERIDYAGKVVVPLRREEVQEKLQYLVDKGATGFVVSLLWCFVNPVHEQMVRDIIKEEYPDVYLGSQPILLSSEVMPKKDEYQRTMSTILTAYLHRAMAEELTTLGDELKDSGYKKSLFLVHNTGGIAPLYETTSIKTYNAGPVGGLVGAQLLGSLYNYNNVIATDMGGTSFDIGLVADGEVRFYGFVPLIDWWRVGLTMIETKSIGAGGGSVAWVNELLGNVLQVGPQSAGSMPGPACFDFGGEEPTVTDADVVLGYVNPDYYLGGKVMLNKERAAEAIREKIAKPLGLSVEEAAWAIKRIVDGNMGNEIFKEVHLRGYDPRDFLLLAFGGAGATHCCGYGEFVGVKKMVVPYQASVFSAYGIALMDVVQIYEASQYLRLYDTRKGSYLDMYDTFNRPVKRLQQKALSDLAKEGYKPESIVFSLELEMRYGQQRNTTKVLSPRVWIQSEKDLRAIEEAFTKAYNQTYSAASAFPEGGVEVISFCLRATVPMPKPPGRVFPFVGVDSQKALKGMRSVYWGEQGYVKTRIYDRQSLANGNAVEGPAIVEDVDTTYVLPQGFQLTIDDHLNGIIEKVG